MDQDAFLARVLAAFFAAVERPAAPLVWAAFFAAAEREPALRRDALFLACDDKADLDAALCPSRFNALVVALERFAAGLRCSCEAASSCAAFFFVALLAVFLGFAFTPARRAFDKPMAIACLVERAPCLPSRTCSISSRTYSPACVLADFPSFLSLVAARRA